MTRVCLDVYVYMYTYARCVHMCGVRAGFVCTHSYFPQKIVRQLRECLYMHYMPYLLMCRESHDYAQHRHMWVSHVFCAPDVLIPHYV